MLRQILFGSAVSFGNIAIHALAMVVIVRWGPSVRAKSPSHPTLHLVVIMIATVSVLMTAHFGEIAVWSLVYAWVGAAPAGTDHLYFAFVNYTTLGYGDVVPAPEWRLVGPMTAMNGVLLFGWSTAVIFHILRVTLGTPPDNL